MRPGFLTAVAVSALGLLSISPGEEDAALSGALRSITANSLRRHVAFLGSDALEGRATGSRGEELAADYLADQLAALKLTPLGNGNSYFQTIPMHGSRPLPESRLSLVGENTAYDLELGRDYLLYTSGEETYVPHPLPLVFVGYGIIAPEFDHNDYQTIDVDGKIVVFLEGEPSSPDSAYFNGELPTVYALPEAKRRLALSRGAAGSILIPQSAPQDSMEWERLRRAFSFEEVKLAYSVTSTLSLIINPRQAERLFENAPVSFREVLAMEKQGNLSSFDMSTRLSFRGEFSQRNFIAANVLGLWKGRSGELQDSYVLVTAHYDHLGSGPPVNGDSIYNGVMDNAVGVAAVLELAKAFTLLPTRPLRSMIFLFVTGEEKGLLGSRFYLDHPAVPLYKTIANVNVDGLAMFDRFNDVVGIGAELSTLEDVLGESAREAGLRVSTVPPQFRPSEPYARSDQIAFAQAGIPALITMEGVDFKRFSRKEALERFQEWGKNIYHSPFDELAQPLNFQAGEQHCRFLFRLVYNLANRPAAPEWKSGVPYINARLQSIAEKR